MQLFFRFLVQARNEHDHLLLLPMPATSTRLREWRGLKDVDCLEGSTDAGSVEPRYSLSPRHSCGLGTVSGFSGQHPD
ncbi:MAG: hypothetical protein CMJ64_08215 [Planctomycetaceae bacterium]|nr:hypothetical protein [Planctomycetaceae bacterium]